jgi:hypothetical protein
MNDDAHGVWVSSQMDDDDDYESVALTLKDKIIFHLKYIPMIFKWMGAGYLKHGGFFGKWYGFYGLQQGLRLSWIIHWSTWKMLCLVDNRIKEIEGDSR